MADDSDQTSSVLTDVVALQGGGINPNSDLRSAWIIKPVIVEGLRFADIYIRDWKCKRFFEENFAMVNHIKKLRNIKVTELMQALTKGNDPNEDGQVQEEMLYQPKRQLIDQIPPMITIDVVTRSGIAASVNVLPAWREKGVLQIELTQDNMDLLLEEPPAEPAPWRPRVDPTDVYCGCVRCG